MTAEQWHHLETLFGRAISLPESDWEQIVEELSADDPSLGSELRRLLSNYARGTPLLERASCSPTLRAGEIVADRFEIVRFHAAGGMGEVYLAADRELQVSVALKLLPEHFSKNSEMISRFRQEVHLARTISHPNVCRVFDLGTLKREGVSPYFLTMEFIQGEPLAEHLRLGALECAEAKRVFLEILDGLDAVHKCGVLHRDLKPSNIMLRSQALSGGERVVVMDFGLARHVTGEGNGPLTGSRMLGTPLYMAPENIATGLASSQTDLYSLALIGYEMFTGQPAGSADNPLAAIVRRSIAAPESIRSVVPGLERNWDQALVRCLDPDPSRRPASTQELRSLLIQPNRRVTLFPTLTRRQVMVAALTLGVAGITATLRPWLRHRTVLQIGAQFMLAPVQNLTGDPTFNAFATALIAHLGQSSYFSVVEPAQFPNALNLMLKGPKDVLSPSELRHLALRVQVALVLYATLSKVGSSYSLFILGEYVSPGSALASSSFSKSFLADTPRELFSALDEASRWLRQTAGEPADAISLNSRRPEEVTTDSWEALRDFSQGQEEAAADRRETALAYFDAAIRRDPLFVMAHSRRGDLLYNLGREEEGLRSWSDAIQALDRRPCSRREELATRAMFASDTGDFVGCVRYYEELAKMYPSDSRAWRYRMMPLGALDRRKEAKAVAEHYVTILPDSWTSWFQLANAAILANDFDAAWKAVGKLRELGPQPQTREIEFQLYFQQSKYDQAESAMRQALEISRRDKIEGRISEYSRRLAHYLADRGRLSDAVALLETGLEEDERNGLRAGQAQKLVSLSYLQLGERHSEKNRIRCMTALSLDPSVERYKRCGVLLARLGASAEAAEVEKKLERFPQSKFVKAALSLIRGEIATARGNADGAIGHFNQADQELPPVWAREHWLHFARLRNDRAGLENAVRQIVASKGSYWWWIEMDWPGLYGQAIREGSSDSAAAESRLLFAHN